MQRGETESDGESGEDLPRGERTRQQQERNDQARQSGNEEHRSDGARSILAQPAARRKRGAAERSKLLSSTPTALATQHYKRCGQAIIRAFRKVEASWLMLTTTG